MDEIVKQRRAFTERLSEKGAQMHECPHLPMDPAVHPSIHTYIKDRTSAIREHGSEDRQCRHQIRAPSPSLHTFIHSLRIQEREKNNLPPLLPFLDLHLPPELREAKSDFIPNMEKNNDTNNNNNEEEEEDATPSRNSGRHIHTSSQSQQGSEMQDKTMATAQQLASPLTGPRCMTPPALGVVHG